MCEHSPRYTKQGVGMVCPCCYLECVPILTHYMNASSMISIAARVSSRDRGKGGLVLFFMHHYSTHPRGHKH